MIRIHREPLIAFLALSIAGCGDDSTTNTGGGGAPTVHPSWGGTWQLTTQPSTTLGPAIEVNVTRVCGGISVVDLLGLAEIFDGIGTTTCTGTWTDTVADVQCVIVASIEGCTATATVNLDATRSGDTFAGTQSAVIDIQPSECGPSEQISLEFVAERWDTEQFGCGSNLAPGVPASWGGTWNVTETPVGLRASGGTLVCPGTTADQVFYDPSFGASTTGGFTDTSAEVFATWSEVQGQCLALVTDRIEVTRTGDSVTGTRDRVIRIIPDPNQIAKCTGLQTLSWQITGTRVSTDVGGCPPGAFPLRPWRSADFRFF
jgi:hypothetical protein